MTVVLTASLASAAAPEPSPPPAEIESAIEKGIAFLYTMQGPDGTWEITPEPPKNKPADNNIWRDDHQWGGYTATIVYTLLTCGERPTEAKLQKAIKFLHAAPINSVYGLSMKCQVWARLPPTTEVKKSLRRDATMLLSLRKGVRENYTVWDYQAPDPNKLKDYNFIHTQAAVWGLAAAADAEFEVPTDIWRAIERTYTAAQGTEGGWRFKFEAELPKSQVTRPPKMSETAYGAGALQMAQDFTRTDAAPRGNVASPALDKAVDWISKNFDKTSTADGATTPEDTNPRLFSLEQFALASGLRRFGDNDWYADGARYYVKAQKKKEGYWGSVSRTGTDYRPFNTCWAMLYLQRGRVPLAINKLDYSDASENPKKALWNQRPRDAANLTRWIGRTTERELRWQIVDAKESLEAMLEAPVLYVAGGDTLTLKADAKAKIKTYVEHGGLLFAAADGGNPAFSKSVERLALDLFPGNEWRDLPDTHPVFANQMYKRSAFKTRPLVRAFGNGVREFFLLIPAGDPAKTWQQRGTRTNPDAWQLAADVVSYAVDKSNFYSRGTTWLAPSTTVAPKRTLTIGRLKYNGKWDVEPAAWPQFVRYAQSCGTGITLKTLEPGAAVDGIDVVYVSGAAAFTFDDATRDALKTFLDAGGRIFFEAVGGNAAFAASAQAELTRWFGADALAQLSPSHALYGEKLPIAFRGYNIATIDKPTEPQLRAVEKDGRVVAILSREDITVGLLGVPTDGITGYTPDTARALLGRVLARWTAK